MAYGSETRKNIARINEESSRTTADWSPDAFTLPFPERFLSMIGNYFDLPSDPWQQKAAVSELIMNGAKERGIRFSRTTLGEWLAGGRDPSVSGSDQKTRENIYRVCAALDFDMELTQELFEKVFFTRAYFPKDLQELAWYYFARRDYELGEPGAGWYAKGLRVTELLQPDTEEKPITETSMILRNAEVLEEAEFVRFLSRSGASFTKENRNRAARDRIRLLALECCEICDIGRASELREIPWDTLINRIIGYNQRGLNSAGPVSGMKNLPAQLTTNFPTGQILKNICNGDETGFDRICKMLCLLMFRRFFFRRTGDVNGFLRFANLQLDEMGFPELYPGQPYCGMLLFCAAQKDPNRALREFICRAAETESEQSLLDRIRRVFPSEDAETEKQLLLACGKELFTVDLLCALQSKKPLNVPDLLRIWDGETDGELAAEQTRQYLLDETVPEEEDRALLRAFSLFPPAGITEELFGRLFTDPQKRRAEDLAERGWVRHADGLWRMDFRIRGLVFDQDWFPRGDNCRAFAEQFLALWDCEEVSRDALRGLAKKLRTLNRLDPLLLQRMEE